MDLSISYLWLIGGLILILAEALGVSGLGLMFAGIGALVTSSLLNFGVLPPDAHLAQFVLCLAATAACAFFLWKPLQKYRHRHGGYSNIIGETAFTGSGGLIKGHIGEATWSGTIMKAEIAGNAPVEKLDAAIPVTIVDVTGNKLIVKPKG